MLFFLCIVYLYLFVTYNLGVVIMQLECLRGWAFVDEGGETFFFSVDLFQITPSESEPTWQCDDVDAEGTAPW